METASIPRQYNGYVYFLENAARGGPRLFRLSEPAQNLKPQTSNFKFQNKTQIPNPKNWHLNLGFWICFGF